MYQWAVYENNWPQPTIPKIAVHRPVQGFKDPKNWCATMLKFQQKVTSLPIPPNKKNPQAWIFQFYFTSLWKKHLHIKTRPPKLFEKKHSKRYPKNRSKLTIEKKTTKHSQCPPPLPPFAPQHAESLLKAVNATPPGWKNRFQREWRCVKAALEGWKETDSRTPNFFSAICLVHRYFVDIKKLQKRK